MYHNFWKYYFESLNIDLIFSKPTDKEIIDLGMKYSNDEMCTSLKNFLGHIAYIKDRCDYVLLPRIDNYGIDNQMCTNFLAIYDLASNIFDCKFLNYNINYENKEIEMDGLIKIGTFLGKSKKECVWAYEIARIKNNKYLKKLYIDNRNKLKSNSKKILLLGHDYNIHDNLIGGQIINYLNNSDYSVILGDSFSPEVTLPLSKNICKYLYWYNSKKIVGALEYCRDNIDGVILLSTFPCGLDSIVNELIIRRVNLPVLNLIVDDINSFTGLETRLESFLDVIGSH